MSFEEIRVLCVVYVSALAPLIYLIYKRDSLPRSVLTLYACIFIACAFGWELWFTYGWIDGDPVNIRRSAALNTWLPQNINWLMNSLADAGTIGLGGLYLTWLLCNRDNAIFITWSWRAFTIFMLWCVGQNIGVEMFLYHDQLAEGKILSWAPLAPLGSYVNPELIEFNGRRIMLQTQIPWLILPPLIYYLAIFLKKRDPAQTN
jgi:hypothetical protein